MDSGRRGLGLGAIGGALALALSACGMRAEAQDKNMPKGPAPSADAADLVYRYHWASRQFLLKHDIADSGLNEDIIVERHRALNWLIGSEDQPWDEVTTDT